MLQRTIKANNTEVMIFNSSEYVGDLEAFLDSVNSWCNSQPDNAVIEDIIYRHSGLTAKGKDILSIAIISRLTRGNE